MVSVPYRGAIFLNENEVAEETKKPETVSVPYRGAIFLNTVNLIYNVGHSSFPSPIGELYFSIGFEQRTKDACAMFPSPIGELYFSIQFGIGVIAEKDSFRPLSGSYISQFFLLTFFNHLISCFRPLSGSYISQ